VGLLFVVHLANQNPEESNILPVVLAACEGETFYDGIWYW
jgi:hypothetical protein